MPVRYAHTNLIARDWVRLAAFYVDAFGCEPLDPERDLSGDWLDRGTAVEGAHIRGRQLRLPGHGPRGPTLEIFSYDRVADAPDPRVDRAGFGHIAFAVDDVEATLEAVLAAGGARHGEVVTKRVEGAGELTFTYARDPEGNLIELQAWR